MQHYLGINLRNLTWCTRLFLCHIDLVPMSLDKLLTLMKGIGLHEMCKAERAKVRWYNAKHKEGHVLPGEANIKLAVKNFKHAKAVQHHLFGTDRGRFLRL